MSAVLPVRLDTFEQEVTQAPLPVLVDFFAAWCGPCHAVAPFVEEVAREWEGRLKVVKVDVDESPDLAGRFGIRGVPTLMLFRDGQEVARIVGAVPKQEIVRAVERALAAGA